MQDGPKAVWSISYVSVDFFPSLKQNCMAYRSSKVSSRPDCIFEIHKLWQSGFRWVYSNCCSSFSFDPEIMKIFQSYHDMYSNNILSFQESTSILNACTKKSGNVLKALRHHRNPPLRVGCDTRSVFKLCLTCPISEFSFSLSACHCRLKGSNLLYCLLIAGRKLVKCIFFSSELALYEM